jgi:hypothetical protein
MHNICIHATQGWYPVMYAVKEGHIEIVKECFDLVDHAITTKVHMPVHFFCTSHCEGHIQCKYAIV